VKAVLPVHLNGQPCDMNAIHQIAQDNKLAVLEDACHALGGSIGDQPIGAGTAGQTIMFSLHPVKAIAMGEGGVLTTSDPYRAERFRVLRNHGLIQARDSFRNEAAAFDANGDPNPWYYELHDPSPNYRASDIHCALGRSQLRKLERFTAQRHKLAALYDQELADLSPVLRPIEAVNWGESGHHLYPVLIDFDAIGRDRASLMGGLRKRNIGTQVHYIPVHRQPYYADLCPDTTLPGADRYYARCLSLPLSVSMDEDDVRRVARALHAEL
jgi:dTDP-4-amino-4,6-dideoxygalactose transaminase